MLSASKDIFTSGFEGYPCYRIPALLRLPNSLVLAFAEGRRGGDTAIVLLQL